MVAVLQTSSSWTVLKSLITNGHVGSASFLYNLLIRLSLQVRLLRI